MVFVIVFDNSEYMGGFGDRVVGIISISLISRLLNKEFFIDWKRETVKNIIEYNDFEKSNINNDNFKVVKIMNANFSHPFIKKLKNENIKSLTDLNNIFFYCNFELSKFLFHNKFFSNLNYYDEILKEYKLLYSDTIKIKNKDYVTNLIGNKSNIIGIQIRAGRPDWKEKGADVCNPNYFLTSEIIIKNLNNIKNHIELTYNIYYVFITSDFDNIYNISLDIFGDKLIYNNLEITHIDRNPNLTTIDKVFIDSYILSQHTNRLYISSYSNYGRISALSSIHNEIYDSENCKKLEPKNLLSKH
tara:strand:+ start:596 stop:1501 length:906 start_codon:yes stop_codon:yes gene_type:complete